MVRSKAIHEVFAIAASAVFMLAAPRLAVAQSLVWTDAEPLNNNAGTEPVSGFPPEVTTDGSGNWVAAWTSRDSLGGTIGTDQDILVSVSSDNGLTWTAPEPLNNNATTDAAFDAQAELTTDGTGNWVAVCHSDDPLGGTIGTDFDILVARSPLDGQPIPTVSEWGLIVMSLLVLTAGTLVYARRRPAHA